MNRLDGAPTLPIKDDTDQAVDALARELYETYDITPEQAQQMARSQVMKSLDAQSMSGQPTVALSLAEMHRDAGASPESAYRLGANQVATYGPAGAAGLYREYQTPEGMERLVQAQAENRAADARHQRMYDDYFTATGAPSHQQPSPELQRQWDDSERYAREQGRIIRSGLHPQTPVAPGTPEQQRSFEQFLADNPEEMARLRPDQYAAEQQATLEQEMADRMPLLIERYGEEEAAKVVAAAKNGKTYVPATSEQREANDLRQDNETAAMKGNTASRAVLQMNDREQRDAVHRPRQLRELGIDQSLSGDKLAAAVGLQPGSSPKSVDERIRNLLRARRASDEQKNDLLWRPRTMAQAGNAVGAAALPGMSEWQLQMLAGGPTPLAVDAVGAQNALRMMNAEALAGMDPFKRQMQEWMMEEKRRQSDPTYAAAQDIAEGKWDSARGIAEVDRLRDSMDNDWTGFSYESEQRLAARLQQPPYNMKQAEAEAAAHASANRERYPWNRSSAPASQRPADPPRPARPGYIPLDS